MPWEGGGHRLPWKSQIHTQHFLNFALIVEFVTQASRGGDGGLLITGAKNRGISTRGCRASISERVPVGELVSRPDSVWNLCAIPKGKKLWFKGHSCQAPDQWCFPEVASGGYMSVTDQEGSSGALQAVSKGIPAWACAYQGEHHPWSSLIILWSSLIKLSRSWASGDWARARLTEGGAVWAWTNSMHLSNHSYQPNDL